MTAATGTFPEIPFFDLKVEEEDLEAVAETLRSGWLTMGPRTAALEQAFAEYVGGRHAVALSSCTAALHLAYLGAGVGPGDEVIVPAFTFAATAAAVIYCGAKPVFADIIGRHDLSIDPEDVERKISDRTKAVCAVHFAGYPAPVDRLLELCDERGIALIEDAAHGPGATLHGQGIGTFGLAGCFSFFSNKVLSVGEGGMLVTDDDDVAEKARRLRSYGMTSGTWARHSQATTTYDVTELGFNYKLDEPRSAMLMSRLKRLDKDIATRRELIMRYRRSLSEVPGLTLPFRDEDVATASGYVMPILLDDPEFQSEFRARLREGHGVQTSVFYPATHEFTAYRERYWGVSLPKTELAARTEVTIPLYAHMTDDDQQRVITAIREALA
ncbi:MAG TPA: DegT/DnrJ/EryC1/StrS family aminotransferase [Thermoleophilaceae bacterium]